MTYCRLLVRSMADRSGKADGITYVTRVIRRPVVIVRTHGHSLLNTFRARCLCSRL